MDRWVKFGLLRAAGGPGAKRQGELPPPIPPPIAGERPRSICPATIPFGAPGHHLASETGLGLGSADTIGLTSLICVGYVISVVFWDTFQNTTNDKQT